MSGVGILDRTQRPTEVVNKLHEVVNLGGGDLTSAGHINIFIVKYETEGDHLCGKHFGKACGDDIGTGVAVNGEDHAFVMGFAEDDRRPVTQARSISEERTSVPTSLHNTASRTGPRRTIAAHMSSL